MEKYAKKAKITLPSKEGFALNKWKLLIFLATITYTIAFFTPWIREHYFFSIMLPEIYPSPAVPREGWFWSFLAVIRTTRNDYRILLFWDYWFDVSSIPFHGGFSGWIGIFIFEFLTILIALITIHRKNKDKWLGTVITAVLSIMAPILCVYQQPLQLSYSVVTSQFSIGFWLALISSIVFLVSCKFAKNAK
jgi:hypothetical protein